MLTNDTDFTHNAIFLPVRNNFPILIITVLKEQAVDMKLILQLNVPVVACSMSKMQGEDISH